MSAATPTRDSAQIVYESDMCSSCHRPISRQWHLVDGCLRRPISPWRHVATWRSECASAEVTR